MQVLPQAEVKKGISLDEWVKLLFTWVVNTVCDHYGEGMIAPAEISFSQDVILYDDSVDSGDFYTTRVNTNGVLQAVYWGDNHEKSGRIYLQHFKNAFSGIYEIEDEDEFIEAELAKVQKEAISKGQTTAKVVAEQTIIDVVAHDTN